MTVEQAFCRLLLDLEPTEQERAEVSEQQRALVAELRRVLGGIRRGVVCGAFSRRTIIRPLAGVDLLVILDADSHRDVCPSALSQSPLPCLYKVQSALARAFPCRDVRRIHGHSVNIDLGGTGISHDVIPAFEVDDGLYLIPDARRTGWIKTRPEVHSDALATADRRAGGKLTALIRLAKLWKRRRDGSARRCALGSFHIEVMAYSAISGPPPSYPAGLLALLGHLASTVRHGCPDPSGVGPDVDRHMTQAERCGAWLSLAKAAAWATRAIALDARGQTEDAHVLWRALLGPDYPGRGQAPQRW